MRQGQNSVSPYAATQEKTASRNVCGDGHMVRFTFSELLVFLIASFSVSLEKRLAQIHPVEEIL